MSPARPTTPHASQSLRVRPPTRRAPADAPRAPARLRVLGFAPPARGLGGGRARADDGAPAAVLPADALVGRLPRLAAVRGREDAARPGARDRRVVAGRAHFAPVHVRPVARPTA